MDVPTVAGLNHGSVPWQLSRVYSYLADQKTVTCTVKLTTPPFPELEIKLAELNHGSRHACIMN